MNEIVSLTTVVVWAISVVGPPVVIQGGVLPPAVVVVIEVAHEQVEVAVVIDIAPAGAGGVAVRLQGRRYRGGIARHPERRTLVRERGPMTRGLPTSYAAGALSEIVSYGPEDIPAWPDPGTRSRRRTHPATTFLCGQLVPRTLDV